MSLIPDNEFAGSGSPQQSTPRQDLVSWVMSRVDKWRDVRETTFRKRWDEYYRIWRGRWGSEDRSRRTERSKLIAPASQIAVDTAAAELLEAIFSREQFVDIADDIADDQKADAIAMRDALVEDLRKDGIVETLTEITTLGALYGQFIGKIVTDVEVEAFPQVIQNEAGAQSVIKASREKVRIYPVAVEPGQLVVDPAATCIDNMLGAAHEFELPLHIIDQRQSTGTFYDTPVGRTTDTPYTVNRTEEGTTDPTAAQITEYHGLVPRKMLEAVQSQGRDDLEELLQDIDDDDMIDAIVTIANKGTLLRAIPNPCVMEDRALISEQFDTVPNRFWGRGVLEKGYNMQKALDSELRARSDGLAWTNNPMFAFDITKLPPGSNLDSWPGKGWGLNGNPRESLMPLSFGTIDNTTFQQASELERMLQFATGAIDPSVLNAGTRDQATGASAVNVSGIVKRYKRTMLNMESFLTRLVKRVAYRKMQYEPTRFPFDFNFVVRGTVGIMAREIEQQFNMQMLQFAEKGTPEYAGILKLILDQSTHPDKAQLIKMLEVAMQPPSEEEQAKAQEAEQLQQQIAVEQLRNVQADTALKLASAGSKEADAIVKRIEGEMIDDKLQLDTVKAQVDVQQAVNQDRQIEVTERKQRLEEAKFSRGDI